MYQKKMQGERDGERGREQEEEEGLRVQGQGGKWRNLTLNKQQITTRAVFFPFFLHLLCRGLWEGGREGGKELEEHGGELSATGQRKLMMRWHNEDLKDT